MCVCNPLSRTPWCGKPGCEMPKQSFARSRPSVGSWLMQLAGTVALRSACVKRAVGAVLAKDGRVLSVGYNGTPRGWKNCDEGGCPRCAEGAAAGDDYARCLCCHAEENAIVQAARHGTAVEGATLYTLLSPCVPCARKIVNAGIDTVVYEELWPEGGTAIEVLETCGVECIKLSEGEEHE